MYTKVVIVFILLVLFGGCGSGGGSTSDSDSKYSSTEAENNIYVLDGAFNDISGLSNWSEIIYNYYFDNLILEDDTQLTEKYVNKTLNCLSEGSMIINGNYRFNDSNSTYYLDIKLNNCEIRGQVLSGKILLDIFTDEKLNVWNVTFDNFITGANLSNASHTTGELLQHNTASGYGYVILNTTVYNEKSKVLYHDFKMSISQLGSESTTSLEGSYEISQNKYSCINKNYTINTFSPLNFENDIAISGEIGINNIGYTFNADESIDVVDGRTMFTIKTEDYDTLKCDDN